MSVQLLNAPGSGLPLVDAEAIMANAIELTWAATPIENVDVEQFCADLRSTHNSLLKVVSRVIAMQPQPQAAIQPVETAQTAPAPTTAPQTDLFGEPAPVAPPRPSPKPAAAAAKAPTPLPTVSKTATPGRTDKAVADLLGLAHDTQPRRNADVDQRRRRSDFEPKPQKLPRRLSKVEEALMRDRIICLEDGRAVTDLGKHLATLNMTPNEYRKKWGLPPRYPMKAPSLIQTRGTTYEWDPISRKMFRV